MRKKDIKIDMMRVTGPLSIFCCVIYTYVLVNIIQ